MRVVGLHPEADFFEHCGDNTIQALPTEPTLVQMDQYRSKLLKNWRPAGLKCKTAPCENV
jgi:hypothetical protein